MSKSLKQERTHLLHTCHLLNYEEGGRIVNLGCRLFFFFFGFYENSQILLLQKALRRLILHSPWWLICSERAETAFTVLIYTNI